MRKLNTSILVGIIVAILGFGVVFAYGKNVDDRVADGRETQTVLVAKEALASGKTTAQLRDLVEERDVPTAYLADDVLTSLDDVPDHVLLGPLPKDGQLTKAVFGLPEQAGAVAPSEGNVAIAVSVELAAGAARYITAGSTVDVFVTYDAAGPQGEPGADPRTAAERTKLAVSGVKVLAVSIAEPKRSDSQDDDVELASNEVSVNGVLAVLDLDPRDAERVVNGTELGSLYLGLSSDGATHKTPTGVVPNDVVVSNR